MAVDERTRSRTSSLALPGWFLGVGLGGFVDGILLHQLLQWHHLFSNPEGARFGAPTYPVDTVRGLELNTLGDGAFHVVAWLSVLVGLALLFERVTEGRATLWRRRDLWGWILVGFGSFNVVEGVVDHHVLQIHHVREGPDAMAWDLGFLALGVLLVAAGWLLQRSSRR